MEFIKEKTACFSGHRTYKAHGMQEIEPILNAALVEAIERGYDTFLSGMCEGFDLLAAVAVLELRKKRKYRHIKLMCAIPFLQQPRRWPPEAWAQYDIVFNKMDGMHIVSQRGYYRGVYHARNRYMVDNSSLLISYFNGSPGGTAYTVRYSEQQGIEVQNLFKSE